MASKSTFAVIGGDLRQFHLARQLAAEGHGVSVVGFDREMEGQAAGLRADSPAQAVKNARCVVLPLPFTTDGVTVNAPFARAPVPLEEIWGAAGEEKLVTGGKLNSRAYEAARSHGFKLVDYYGREELKVLNTIPTAEGAVQIAMEELPVTIHGAECLVTGFGHVAKTLCCDLKALGARVTACARRYSDLAWMKAMGYTPLPLSRLGEEIGNFDVVFNTVPAVILTEPVLSKVKKDCLVVDLASKPGGVDFETAGRLNVKTIWALSLPGKVAPITSGSIIKDTILNILAEEGS